MNKSSLFAVLFRCSKIIQNFIFGKTKCSYVIYHGLAPYFQESLVEQILNTPFIVTRFDESYNRTVKKGQMDVKVKFWNKEKGQVGTR